MESTKNILKITGIGYLIIFVTGFYSNFFVLENLIVPGNAFATFSNISADEMLFRYAITGFTFMVIFDLLLAWTLYLLLKNVNKNLSLLSAWLRLVNAAIFGLALFNLLNVLKIVNNPKYAEFIGNFYLQTQVLLSLDSFNHAWQIGLIFFGLHLILLGYLIFKSDFIPKVIGILLFIAGIGYLIDSFANFIYTDYDSVKEVFQMIVIIPGVIGEFSFTVWLLIRGFISKKNS